MAGRYRQPAWLRQLTPEVGRAAGGRAADARSRDSTACPSRAPSRLRPAGCAAATPTSPASDRDRRVRPEAGVLRRGRRDHAAGHGRARPRPAGAAGSTPARAHRAAADRLRRGTRPALGRLRIRVQRARSRAHLSVFELRSAGPGTQARPLREQGDGAVRHRARRHDRRRSRVGQLHRVGRTRRARSLSVSTRRWTSRPAAFRRANRR